MKKCEEKTYTEALEQELVPALGCTEPIAIAFAAAKAREVLGEFPSCIEISCSGNIIKNVKGVKVPNSDGMRGIEAAATLGVVGGNADRELEVLEEVTAEDIARAKELLEKDYATVSLQHDVDNLYIDCKVKSADHSAQVVVINRHTLIADIVKDGETIFHRTPVSVRNDTNWDCWSIRGILDYAQEIDLDEIRPVIRRQIEMNTAISEAGLNEEYGAEVGRTLLETETPCVQTYARAAASAGSDARMGGCSLPVVINSGSGNQGMTVSLPVIEYAKAIKCDEDKLYRALVISNLVSMYQKHFIGNLSSFCGAVTAASGAGAAITWLSDGTYEQICGTIVNTVGNVGGIICDGAKASCAAKIASAVGAAVQGHELSMRGKTFLPGEGIVGEDIEETIRRLGYIGRIGMMDTDKTVLNLMIGTISP